MLETHFRQIYCISVSRSDKAEFRGGVPSRRRPTGLRCGDFTAFFL